jgi:U3 small nucleolar RNA-associated protein 4
LSIKYNENSNIFYTGLSNGNILKWDYNTGQVLMTLNIPSNKQLKKGDSPMIWALGELNNKYLFTGDSSGLLRVWDIQFGVVLKEFREHIADILSICVNKKNNTVFFTGSDSIICSLNLMDDEWTLSSKFRGQSHDINSILLLR